jgi:GTP-binding protein LepA
VHVGDTITHPDRPGESLKGFEEVKPMVFAGIYPVDTTEFEELRASMEKLKLNDASLVWELETSAALGFGFRCGFLGMLHMEIIQERLEREFNMTVITTVPSVEFKAFLTDGEELSVNAPSEMPDPTRINYLEEPYIKAQIISKSEYIGPIISLCMDKRGVIKNQNYLTTDRVEMSFEMPLSEIVFDFFDKLKSISRGYASLDYQLIGFRESDMVKLDVMLNGEKVDALSAIVHRAKSHDWGRKLCEKLRELIPRQMFDIAIQAAIGQKIVARENLSAIRKNVLAKCYGGDISRKRKLLDKQKKGKKRMRQIGSVEVPQEAFMAILKIE